MRAMRADTFSGYGTLKLVDLPETSGHSDGEVLVRMTAAGVTPLEHTILSGQFPIAKAPLVLGSEGAGVVEEGGGRDVPVGSRVMFTGPYGVFADGAYSEWLAVRKQSLCLIPRECRRRERRRYSGRVPHRADGSHPRWFSAPHEELSNRLGSAQQAIRWEEPRLGGVVGHGAVDVAEAVQMMCEYMPGSSQPSRCFSRSALVLGSHPGFGCT